MTNRQMKTSIRHTIAMGCGGSDHQVYLLKLELKRLCRSVHCPHWAEYKPLKEVVN